MEKLKIDGFDVVVRRCETLIVGAGAAAMNCAVHLAEFNRTNGKADFAAGVKIITGGIPLGTSRMSGSDKQTYYKLGTSAETADSAMSMAKSLTAAGCCHEDLALIESITSLREFFHLVRSGVPFPHDSLGSFVGYKTDHDPFERATSAGPKTSKFMCDCLQRETQRLGVEMIDNQEVVHLFSDGGSLAGILTIDKKLAAAGDMKQAFSLWQADNYVLATGGPGELYKTSVYPASQPSIHGLCLMAGMKGDNLTESQFGLASTKFRWNVSGTYMQAVPRIFSTAADGSDEKDFLNDAFDSTSLMATNIFLKGYQWPFDPQRIDDKKSSLIDMLVFRENQNGRRVFMDFRNNPKPIDDVFAVEKLLPEARDYLTLAGATQQTPIERLAHMNIPAIEIYDEHNIDIRKEPLEISVCHQHCNGGIAVDTWWHADGMDNVFVIGELAGTHGVKRPGGSALNAGQAGGIRAAEFITNATCVKNTKQTDAAAVKKVLDVFKNQAGGINPVDALERLKEIMTANAGHIRSKLLADDAKSKIAKMIDEIDRLGFALKKPADIVIAVRLRHLVIAAMAIVESIRSLLAAGAGSRGSHLVMDPAGDVMDELLRDDAGEPLRAVPENIQLRDKVVQASYCPASGNMNVEMVQVRKITLTKDAFETAWAKYNKKAIY